MQPTPLEGTGTTTTSTTTTTTRPGAGVGEMSPGGLARFRSAPAIWLEALLEEDDGDPLLLKPNQSLTQLLATTDSPPEPPPPPQLFELGGGLSRLNSSPPDFLGNSDIGSDGYLSNFGIPTSYDYCMELSTPSKLTRDALAQYPPPKFEPHQLKQDHGESHSGLIDLDMDKLLEDSVPCRARAKRGCATHPRSIAERVRRTRISDRIRKLQELVPNMDKQTNTADMLDEAVEYVKYLQKQIQDLSEQQRKCTCNKE